MKRIKSIYIWIVKVIKNWNRPAPYKVGDLARIKSREDIIRDSRAYGVGEDYQFINGTKDNLCILKDMFIFCGRYGKITKVSSSTSDNITYYRYWLEDIPARWVWSYETIEIVSTIPKLQDYLETKEYNEALL